MDSGLRRKQHRFRFVTDFLCRLIKHPQNISRHICGFDFLKNKRLRILVQKLPAIENARSLTIELNLTDFIHFVVSIFDVRQLVENGTLPKYFILFYLLTINIHN